jgi:hypothetical protein
MSFKRILEIAILSTLLHITGCATARRGVVVTNCVSDPLTESLHCVAPSGADYDVTWKESANFVCRPPSDDQLLLEASRQK